MTLKVELDERKKEILEAIISDYLRTAEPVGSRTIWRDHLPGLSPATIRNEMADLEAMGLIAQPHTSAGRIPTDAGYRYYVNYLMKARQMTAREEHLINEGLKEAHDDLEEIMHQTLKVLSHLIDYASFIATLSSKTRVYSSGLSHILRQPEFSNPESTRHLLEALEEDDLIPEMIKEYSSQQRITIRIGSENTFKKIKNCSVVMGSYNTKKGAAGKLGVIGPTRMSYAKTTGILESLTRRLEMIMEE